MTIKATEFAWPKFTERWRFGVCRNTGPVCEDVTDCICAIELRKAALQDIVDFFNANEAQRKVMIHEVNRVGREAD